MYSAKKFEFKKVVYLGKGIYHLKTGVLLPIENFLKDFTDLPDERVKSFINSYRKKGYNHFILIEKAGRKNDQKTIFNYGGMFVGDSTYSLYPWKPFKKNIG